MEHLKSDNSINKKKNRNNLKKTIAWILGALAILTGCDDKPQTIKYESSYVENYDQEKNLDNYLQEFKKDHPSNFTKEELDNIKPEIEKLQKLANDIIGLLLINYKNLNNKVIIIDLPSELDLILNESFKNIPNLKFNTVLYISPNWPADKSKIPLVDYTKFFQTYALLKSWQLWNYDIKPDKYHYIQLTDNENKNYELQPLVVMYDYNRFPTTTTKTQKQFVNSYFLEKEDFIDPKDFSWKPSRDKVIIFTTTPINEDLTNYIQELKEHNIPFDIYFVDLQNYKIKNAEKLDEIKTYVMANLNKNEHNYKHHWWGWTPWFIYYRLFMNNNHNPWNLWVKWSKYIVKPNTNITIQKEFIRNFPRSFRWINIKWSAIRWAGAGKWFSARWWLW